MLMIVVIVDEIREKKRKKAAQSGEVTDGDGKNS